MRILRRLFMGVTRGYFLGWIEFSLRCVGVNALIAGILVAVSALEFREIPQYMFISGVMSVTSGIVYLYSYISGEPFGMVQVHSQGTESPLLPILKGWIRPLVHGVRRAAHPRGVVHDGAGDVPAEVLDQVRQGLNRRRLGSCCCAAQSRGSPSPPTATGVTVMADRANLRSVISRGLLVDSDRPWPIRGSISGEKVANWAAQILTRDLLE